MKSRDVMQAERNRLNQLFQNLQEQGKEFDTWYALGALHVLEWILNDYKEPISELILFKFKQQKSS